MVKQKFAGTHADALKKLEEKVSQETVDVQKAIQRLHSNSSEAGGNQRTMASPQWENNPPLNWRKLMNLDGVPVADFDATNTYHPFAYGCGTFFPSIFLEHLMTELLFVYDGFEIPS